MACQRETERQGRRIENGKEKVRAPDFLRDRKSRPPTHTHTHKRTRRHTRCGGRQRVQGLFAFAPPSTCQCALSLPTASYTREAAAPASLVQSGASSGHLVVVATQEYGSNTESVPSPVRGSEGEADQLASPPALSRSCYESTCSRRCRGTQRQSLGHQRPRKSRHPS